MRAASARNFRKELIELERQYWLAEIKIAGWNICQVCRNVNVNRQSLYKRLAKLGIKRTGPMPPGGRRGSWAAQGL